VGIRRRLAVGPVFNPHSREEMPGRQGSPNVTFSDNPTSVQRARIGLRLAGSPATFSTLKLPAAHDAVFH
jgi:hypothetical protein